MCLFSVLKNYHGLNNNKPEHDLSSKQNKTWRVFQRFLCFNISEKVNTTADRRGVAYSFEEGYRIF